MDVDYNELLEQFSRTVVRIELYSKVPNLAKGAEPKWALFIVIPGIVTTSEAHFCHIIGCSRGFFHTNKSKYKYKVIFPDGTSVNLDINTVETRDWLSAFYVPTTGKIDAVQFQTGNASWRDEVRIFGYNHLSQSILDDGTVTHVGSDDFSHDCPPNTMTYYGYPLFSLKNELVGISYSDSGVTDALSIKYITHLLSSFFEEMDDKPLPEIIEHIKVLGQAKYRELQDSAGGL